MSYVQLSNSGQAVVPPINVSSVGPEKMVPIKGSYGSHNLTGPIWFVQDEYLCFSCTLSHCSCPHLGGRFVLFL